MGQGRAQRSAEKHRRWQQTINRWRQSGESVRAFCRREQLNEPSFYWWRRRLNGTGDNSALASEASPSARPGTTAPSFAEVQLTDASNGSQAAIELTLPTGERLRIGPDVQPMHLQRVIAAVRATTSGSDNSC